MELKQLSYFVTIIQEGTISAAARKLNLTQPPLSAQMRLLEAECGSPLFERGARRVQLTEAGRILYNRAVTLLELADVTRQELIDYRDGNSGTLRLGVVSSVGSTLLGRLVSGFHARHPNISFELVEANTYQLLEQLSANLIELAVVRTPFDQKGLASACLLEEPMLAVGHRAFFSRGPAAEVPGRSAAALSGQRVAPAAPLGSLPSLPLSALDQVPLILYRRWEKILLERFGALHISPLVFCKNDDARTSALWADAGLGVAILPASAASLLHQPDTVLYEISDAALRSSICVVHGKDTWLSTIAESFLSYSIAYKNDISSVSEAIS